MSDFAEQEFPMETGVAGMAPGDPVCPVQLLDLSGEPLGDTVGSPVWCRLMACTREGAGVCDRGCGVSLRQALRETRCVSFQCPFGVSNVVARIGRREHSPVLAVGGRTFHSYSQFRAFVERAIEAGAALGELLSASSDLSFPSPVALRMDFARTIAQLLRDADVDPALGPSEAEAGVDPVHDFLLDAAGVAPGEVAGQPDWAELRRAQEALESVGDPVRLQRLLVEEMRAMSRARKVSLFLADPAAGDLVLVHAVGLPPLVRPGLRRSLSEGVMGKVFSTLDPLVIEDLGKQPILLPSPHGHYESVSFACLPLVSGQDRLGVVNLTDRELGLSFTRADAEWLRTAAQIGAGAARRLALARRLRRVKRSGASGTGEVLGSPLFFRTRLEAEFQRARRYKRALSLMLVQVDMSRWPGRTVDARVPELIARGVANVLGPSVRTFDQVMYYEPTHEDLEGTTVFAVLFPETTLSNARLVAERLQVAVHERFLAHIPHQSDAETALCTRTGVAEYPADVPGLEELRDLAETDLLREEETDASPENTEAAGWLPDVECTPEEEETP